MGQPRESWMTRPNHHLIVLLAAAALVLAAATEAPGLPTAEAVMAWHVTIAPTWFDPSTAPPQITPFGILVALHDALVRPLPNQKAGNSLAGFWAESRDGLGDEGFRKHPIGAGPYKFVSHMPGVEVVLEAYTGYWRRVPNVKRLIMKSVPEGTTRVAMLKKGEADIAYALDGQEAEDVRRDPRLLLVATRHASIFWIEFADQWDPKSPWHDKRLRLAVNHALNRKAINEAACLGFCPPAAVIVPRAMDYALQVEPPAYDPQKARQLLAEAGYPRGFDAGEFVPIPPFFTAAEGVINDLKAVGIRVKMRLVERATFYAEWREKKLRGIFLTAVGNSGNAASRVSALMYSKGG